jgi:predicted aspartyl protease
MTILLTKTQINPQKKLELELQILSEQSSKNVICLIDTGFDGFIAIDENTAEKMKLKVEKRVNIILANGKKILTPVCKLDIILEVSTGTIEFESKVLVIPNLSQPTIGLQLLSDICENLNTDFIVNFNERLISLVK